MLGKSGKEWGKELLWLSAAIQLETQFERAKVELNGSGSKHK